MSDIQNPGNKIKVLITDLYGVNLHRNDAQMYAALASYSGLSESQVKSEIIDAGREAFKIGSISWVQFTDAVNERLGLHLSGDEFRSIWNNSLRADERMLSLLHKLSASGIAVILLSNLNEFDWLDAQAWLLGFEAVLSFQVGLKKPDPEIFKQAMALQDFQPGECFYIDDQMKNILAARELGMQAEQFTDYENLVEVLADRGLVLSI